MSTPVEEGFKKLNAKLDTALKDAKVGAGTYDNKGQPVMRDMTPEEKQKIKANIRQTVEDLRADPKNNQLFTALSNPTQAENAANKLTAEVMKKAGVPSHLNKQVRSIVRSEIAEVGKAVKAAPPVQKNGQQPQQPVTQQQYNEAVTKVKATLGALKGNPSAVPPVAPTMTDVQAYRYTKEAQALINRYHAEHPPVSQQDKAFVLGVEAENLELTNQLNTPAVQQARAEDQRAADAEAARQRPQQQGPLGGLMEMFGGGEFNFMEFFKQILGMLGVDTSAMGLDGPQQPASPPPQPPAPAYPQQPAAGAGAPPVQPPVQTPQQNMDELMRLTQERLTAEGKTGTDLSSAMTQAAGNATLGGPQVVEKMLAEERAIKALREKVTQEVKLDKPNVGADQQQAMIKNRMAETMAGINALPAEAKLTAIRQVTADVSKRVDEKSQARITAVGKLAEAANKIPGLDTNQKQDMVRKLVTQAASSADPVKAVTEATEKLNKAVDAISKIPGLNDAQKQDFAKTMLSQVAGSPDPLKALDTATQAIADRAKAIKGAVDKEMAPAAPAIVSLATAMASGNPLAAAAAAPAAADGMAKAMEAVSKLDLKELLKLNVGKDATVDVSDPLKVTTMGGNGPAGPDAPVR